MAKNRTVNRNAKLAKRDAASAARAEGVVMDRTLPVEDRFKATLKLAQMPRNGAAVRVRAALRADRPFARQLPQVQAVPHHAARSGQSRPDSRAWSRRAGKEGDGTMSISDPLGDMLTRIRNAQRAQQSTVHGAGLEAARQRAGGAEARGLHPRLRGRGAAAGGKPSSHRAEVQRGRAGDREITGSQARPPRLSDVKELPRVYAGLGISILSTPRGVMSDAEARAANVGGEVLCRVF